MRFSIFIILFTGLVIIPNPSQAQGSIVGVNLLPITIGNNVGPYRGRTKETNGPFNQGISFIGQVYFPFTLTFGKWKTDTASTFAVIDGILKVGNKKRLIHSKKKWASFTPSIIIHAIDNGSFAYGGGLELKLYLFKRITLNYQFGTVYLEANNMVSPDLSDGMNLHHFISICTPVYRYSVCLGFVHMSKGGFRSKTSNQDVLTLGIKYQLYKL